MVAGRTAMDSVGFVTLSLYFVRNGWNRAVAGIQNDESGGNVRLATLLSLLR